MKRLIAFSSVSHMGFVTLGIFSLNRRGVKGAVIQMINHGIVSAALFLCIGMIYDRTHTRDHSLWLGRESRPGLRKPYWPWGVALGTTYVIWLYYRVIMGKMNPSLAGLKLDLNLREV
jgi:NADH-quinone oxidoreductase subunit M